MLEVWKTVTKLNTSGMCKLLVYQAITVPVRYSYLYDYSAALGSFSGIYSPYAFWARTLPNENILCVVCKILVCAMSDF